MTGIWITRTQPAAQESADIWREAGFDPLVLPLLNVVPVAHVAVDPDATVIFTSRNGVRHFPQTGHRAICVGDATAADARKAGYRDIVSVDGTSRDVKNWVLANLPTSQSVVHVSGRHVRGHITEDLVAAGYDARRVCVYASRPVLIWPEERIDAVALYSPLAAKTFATVMAAHDTSEMTAICISAATRDELDCLALADCRVAEHPSEPAMLKAAQ